VIRHILGWSKDPGPPQAGGSPATSFIKGELSVKRILNITIDESGDFGAFERHSPYYLVGMLFHDNQIDVEYASQLLDNQVRNLGHEIHSIHTGPIIRRERNYKNHSIDERKRLLNALIHFSRRIDAKYTVLSVEKRECRDIIELTSKISKQIQVFVDKHHLFFHSYDEINVYYDNGQIELTRILTSTLSVLLSNVFFHRIMPSDHKLFQLIDMFCSLELIALKFDTKLESQSELEFFHNSRDFKKDYLKKIRKKRLK
jgi:hypothetical protein